MKKSFQKLIIIALLLGLVCGPVSCGALPKSSTKASSGSSSVQASESTVVAVPYSEPRAPRAILDMPSSGASSAQPSSAPAPGSSAAGGNTSGNSGTPRNNSSRKITVCIDPGHYHGANHLTGENLYDYEEADADLKIAQELSRILKETYGIDSYLTRTGDSISINGYTDEQIDSGDISLRGKCAADADLFISIHTNANGEDANGAPQTSQPIAINKPIIIANTNACQSPEVIKMCNAIGTNISKLYNEVGLATVDYFNEADAGNIIDWSQSFNDGLNVAGTVCKRVTNDGDYYGVLKGAASVGVPGIIIEHGYHTVPEFRYSAMYGDLLRLLAEADAAGIAEYVK